MNIAARDFRADRHPSESYEDILERDSRPIPEHLREGPVPDLGRAPVPVSRYIDADFARLEQRHLWPRVWQLACREEEIPNPGDTLVYEVVGRSLLVTRQRDGTIRAFHNSCLHRGRKLANADGCRTEFRCPYHGIAWRTDGSFKDNAIGWDFPQWEGREPSLPEALVGSWGGFVFVNMDRDARPLDEVIAPLKAHFARYELDDFYISMHVQKVVACNWKVAAEAFMESHHAITTHPQLLPYLADVNSQYDALSDHVTRQFSAGMVQSPAVKRPLTESEIVQAMMAAGSRPHTRLESASATVTVPAGKTARTHVADLTRSRLAGEDGHDYSAASDAELVDALLYNVFPNMSFWAGYQPKLTYRWRPNGTDHESSVMDIYMLKRVPKGQPRPAPAPTVRIAIDESIGELGPPGGMSAGLAAVFEQDMRNLPHVQTGMHASATGVVEFGRYAEMRIRLLHQMIDRYIAEGQAARHDG